MRSISICIIAGAVIGLAAFIIVNQPGPQYASGNDDIEEAADKTSLWGTKQRLSGKGRHIAGKLKEVAGKTTGNSELAGKGVADQVAGAVKDSAGKAADAIGETIHDLNR